MARPVPPHGSTVVVSKCSKFRSAMLNEGVEFQRSAKVSDGSGGFTETWGAIPNAPTLAHVKASGGSERMHSGRVEATSSLRVVTRYFDGLLASDRVVIRDRAYNIRFVDNVEFANRWLQIDIAGGVAG